MKAIRTETSWGLVADGTTTREAGFGGEAITGVVEPANQSDISFHVTFPGDERMADIYRTSDADQGEAFANLIAAAPDLLGACKVLLEAEGAMIGTEYGNQLLGEAITKARAAIARAEGGKA